MSMSVQLLQRRLPFMLAEVLGVPEDSVYGSTRFKEDLALDGTAAAALAATLDVALDGRAPTGPEILACDTVQDLFSDLCDRLAPVEEAQEEARETVRIAFRTGVRHLRRGAPAEALPYFERVLAAQPDNLDAWCNRGVACGMQGEHEAALACFDEALKLDPRFAKAIENRREALRQLGRPEEAATVPAEALAAEVFDQADDELEDALARIAELEAHGELEAALRLCRELRGEHPASAQAWFQEACLQARLHDRDGALEALTRATGIEPDYKGLAPFVDAFAELRGEPRFQQLIADP